MVNKQSVVAAGHTETAHVANLILENGGNAFDAMIASFFAACVTEPVLASVGGGGFTLASAKGRPPITYDFFCQTPRHKKPETQLDFYPITANFGTNTQTFHIGQASIAVPGTIKGMFKIHQDLASLPMSVLLEPAIELAKSGVKLNEFQAYIFDVVSPILTATPSAKKIFCNNDGNLFKTNEVMRQTQFATFLEDLAKYGEDFFYKKDIAHLMVERAQKLGGHLQLDDLERYEVQIRQPLAISYHHANLITNPPPSSGGLLIAFALKLLEDANIQNINFRSQAHLALLIKIFDMTNQVRVEQYCKTNHKLSAEHILDRHFLNVYKREIYQHSKSNRGTTHISIADGDGNLCGMTVSNGEGCGSVLPDTGIMLNNMLGEDDLNPLGYHQWKPNQRLTSMMSPSILSLSEKHQIVLGSGGSNRIRTAILQVISNLIDFRMDLKGAIHAPRLHYENDQLNIEQDLGGSVNLSDLVQDQNIHVWQENNLYFGGVHAVSSEPQGLQGAGDPRRGGIVKYS